jgi:hypothetical protein
MNVLSSLAPESFDGFYSYSVLRSLSIIDRCPMNMNILSSFIKTGFVRDNIRTSFYSLNCMKGSSNPTASVSLYGTSTGLHMLQSGLPRRRLNSREQSFKTYFSTLFALSRPYFVLQLA